MQWAVAALVVMAVLGVVLRRWWRDQWVTPVTDEMIAWQFETFEWLLSNLGGTSALNKRPLFATDLAEAEHLEGPDRAQWVFDAVKTRLGIDHWATRMERVEPAPTGGGPVTMGTYQTDIHAGDGAITYHPELEDSVPKLVTVFAHELSHYIMAAIETENPGGADREEPATDLCAVALGAGVFATNVSLEPVVDDVELRTVLTNPGSIPWASFAYLGLPNFAYALAIVATLQDCVDEVDEQLELYPRFEYRRALRDINRRQTARMDALRAAEGQDVREAEHPVVRAQRVVSTLKDLEDSLERLRSLRPAAKKKPRRKRKKRQ